MPTLPAGVWIAIVIATSAVLLFALYKGAGVSMNLGKIFRADVAKRNDRVVNVANDLDANGAEIGNIAGVRGDTRSVLSAEVAARARLKNTKVGDITGLDSRASHDES